MAGYSTISPHLDNSKITFTIILWRVLRQWHNHGKEVLANTLRILRGIAWTLKDEEGIHQYLQAMVMP